MLEGLWGKLTFTSWRGCFLRRYWWPFKTLWPVRICMTWCGRLWNLCWMKHSGLGKKERVVSPRSDSLHSLLHACSSVLLIACFIRDGCLFFGGSNTSSLILISWVWDAIDCRALGEKWCSLDKRCRLVIISATLRSAGMVAARTERAQVTAVWKDLEMRTLNCRSINLHFSGLA